MWAASAGVQPDSLLTLRGSDRQARQLLIYGVCRYSRAGESLTALAQRFGLSLSGLTMARDRVEQRLRRDKKLREAWSRSKKSSRHCDKCEMCRCDPDSHQIAPPLRRSATYATV